MLIGAIFVKRVEKIDLLLIHCPKTKLLWDFLYSLFSVSWVLYTLVRESLLGWKLSFMVKDKHRVWKGPLCIMWTMWKARDDVVFRNGVLLYKD